MALGWLMLLVAQKLLEPRHARLEKFHEKFEFLMRVLPPDEREALKRLHKTVLRMSCEEIDKVLTELDAKYHLAAS
jgi:hypothetical protein